VALGRGNQDGGAEMSLDPKLEAHWRRSFPKPTEPKTERDSKRLSPDALSWLRERCSTTEWAEVQRLSPHGAEGVLAYIARVAPAAYRQLHELGLVRSRTSLEIRTDGAPPFTTEQVIDSVMNGKHPWRLLDYTDEQKAEMAREDEIERLGGLVRAPDVEFPSEEELRAQGWMV